MKANQFLGTKLVILFMALLAGSLCSVTAQTTAFNFNGRLSNIGLPVNGSHDLRFSVYGSAAGADLVSGPIAASSVPVRNGVFNCKLDFGQPVFDGSARWLEIGVRPSGGASYTNLSPRIELTSAPYAVRAREAAVAASVANGSAVKSLNNLKDNVTLSAGANVTITPSGNTLTIGSTGGGGGGGWSQLGNNTYYNSGNVGIGVTNPTSHLEIVGAQDALKINAYQPVMTLLDSSSGYRTAFQSVFGSLNLFSGQYLDNLNPSGFLQLNDSGNVGIGAVNPVTKLDVRGGLTLETGGNAALFTGTAASEQYRYLNLFNSPSAPSASGLKAGGILVADSYSYANPGKNELIVKGNVSAGGNVTTSGDAMQSRDKNGWVKAMARIDWFGRIKYCYNSQASTGGSCGITVNHFADGGYGVDFGFPVSDRIILVTTESQVAVGLGINYSAYYEFTDSPTRVDVRTFVSGDNRDTHDQTFTIVIF